MALWSDWSSPQVSELIQHDSGVIEVSTTEGVNLPDKLCLARAELSSDLQALLNREGYCERNGVTVRNVVITEPLLRWAIHHTLELVYRDAHYKHLSERYKGKWAEFARLSRQSRECLLQDGLRIARYPVEKPAKPIAVANSGNLAAGIYYLAASVWGELGGESEGSEITAFPLDSPGTITVMAPGASPSSPGWSLYCGLTPENLERQNATPVPVGVPFSIFSIVAGPPPTSGQKPDFAVFSTNRILRG